MPSRTKPRMGTRGDTPPPVNRQRRGARLATKKPAENDTLLREVKRDQLESTQITKGAQSSTQKLQEVSAPKSQSNHKKISTDKAATGIDQLKQAPGSSNQIEESCV